ncbi:MAG: DUF2800 domain-containing protein [Bacillota bacterium]
MNATAIPVAQEPEREHALLSASGAHKWLHCPPSARLEDMLPDQTSVYAEEGRLAHAIAELRLRKLYIEPMGPRKFNAALKQLQADPLYQDEMLRYTDTYVEYVQRVVHSYTQPPHIVVEKQLNYSDYAPEGFGTGDCIIIGGHALHIIDFKYGKGVSVSAESNPQMGLYALGALKEYALVYDIDVVTMAIIQPRLDNISEHLTTADDLRAWGESIKPAAQQAYNGEGEFCAGEWCRFCRAKAQCRAQADTHLALEVFGGKLPPLLTNKEVGDILVRARNLQAWVSSLEDYALSELLKGEEIPGWKAVEGRSTRQFINTDEAFAALVAAGYDEALLYERKPITLTSVEKLLGKAKFDELLKSRIEKPPGKPALALLSDKREAITNKTTAAEAFGKDEN